MMMVVIMMMMMMMVMLITVYEGYMAINRLIQRGLFIDLSD